MKNIDLKVINNISKDKNNGIDIFDEIIKYKNKNTGQGILQVLNIKKKKNINGELDESSIDNEKIKEGTKLKEYASTVPDKISDCVNLSREEQILLYKLLYKILDNL